MIVASWLTLSALAAPPDMDGVRFGGALSNVLVARQGVPDAVRLHLGAGIPLLQRDRFRLDLEPIGALGYSEQDSWSFRVGVQVEAARKWRPAVAYVSTGLHLFRSFTDEEVRLGPLWRTGVGFRFAVGNGYLGFEPLAVERLPNGPGVMTPLRSRWAFEITFLSAGVWL